MAKMYPKMYYGDKIIDAADANLSVASSAVLYGLSVYTVFTVSKTDDGSLAAFRLKDHFQRLQNSSKIIGIDTFEEHWNYNSFLSAVKELIAINNVGGDVYVRATVHVDEQIAGTRSRGMHTVLSMFIYDAEPILKPEGARLKTSPWRRIPDYAIPSRAKVNGAYINSVLAKQDALDSGYDDCIFLDAQGHVCELSAANIFIVRHGEIITPDTTADLLEGINRRTVIEIADEELGMKVVQRPVDLTELYVADEVFASGTSVNITPIVEVDARKVGSGKPGEIAKKLQKVHHDLRHNAISEYKAWVTEI